MEGLTVSAGVGGPGGGRSHSLTSSGSQQRGSCGGCLPLLQCRFWPPFLIAHCPGQGVGRPGRVWTEWQRLWEQLCILPWACGTVRGQLAFWPFGCPGFWTVCPAAQAGMLSSSPLPSLTCPSTPGGPTLLVPGPDRDPQSGVSGTHLPDPNHWAASWTSFVLMHEPEPPGLPTDRRLGPLLLLSWPWRVLSGPGSHTFLPSPLG